MMNNPYYISPFYQDIGSQQKSFQNLMGQGQKLAGQALLPADQQYDPKQLAQGLRNLGQTLNVYSPWQQTATANQYGTDPYSEQSRMLAMQERGF